MKIHYHNPKSTQRRTACGLLQIVHTDVKHSFILTEVTCCSCRSTKQFKEKALSKEFQFQTESVKKFWIVKLAPEGRRIKGEWNRVYLTKKDAIKRANEVSSERNTRMIVLEAIYACEPINNIKEIPIKE